MSELEHSLKFQLKALKIVGFKEEYRFNAEKLGKGPGLRKRLIDAGLKDWRFDFAWPALMLAVEVEGVTLGHGRHQRMAGFNEDLKKYDSAMAQGWTVYRVSADLIHSGQAVKTIEKLLNRLNKQK